MRVTLKMHPSENIPFRFSEKMLICIKWYWEQICISGRIRLKQSSPGVRICGHLPYMHAYHIPKYGIVKIGFVNLLNSLA